MIDRTQGLAGDSGQTPGRRIEPDLNGGSLRISKYRSRPILSGKQHIRDMAGTSPAHILVVDDENSILRMLKQSITSAGHVCSVAENTSAALSILNEKIIDVVITDIEIKGENGVELTRIVRECYDSDVIMMTGVNKTMTYESAIENGARDFVLKPFGIKEMLIKLNYVLTERAMLNGWNQTETELKESFARLERMLDQVVTALASTLEKRDPYTAGHQQRVALLASAIGHEMRLSPEEIEGIRISGLLHDIGKISIPTDILNKPAKLTIQELNLIKEHPNTGYEILKDIEFEQPIAEIVLQHHEMMDGSGYPFGLKGDAIIRQARVLAVSDVVEAIMSHRPYRPALGIDHAMEVIRSGRDSLFDRSIADVCLDLLSGNRFGFSQITRER